MWLNMIDKEVYNIMFIMFKYFDDGKWTTKEENKLCLDVLSVNNFTDESSSPGKEVEFSQYVI